MENKTTMESLEIDSLKVCEAFKRIYKLDDVIILTRSGDILGTFTDSDSASSLAVLKVAHDFHVKGRADFR